MAQSSEAIRIRGLVQGVGFRPTVWRLAERYGLGGWVTNDGDGVSILACGSPGAVQAFVAALVREAPPLARIDAIERRAALPPPAQALQAEALPADTPFRILASHATAVHTGIVPDAATCTECRAEVLDPDARRHRYAFTNCTRCGPRLSIIEALPYDRAATTMRPFTLCRQCEAEYQDPHDRRFHAQPVACERCGPRARLTDADGGEIELAALTRLDAVDAAATLLRQGRIVAIKGLGGFQLACDAGDEAAVARLRSLKRRERKPFALMARDLAQIGRYCPVSAPAAALLRSPAAPIVLLERRQPRPGGQAGDSTVGRAADRADSRLAAGVAPGMATLGFMLPNTPLHHLLLERMDSPLVLTSGNRSDEPQCIDNDEARTRLGGIADYFLLHDRDIARRVDDSVVRIVAGAARLLRRARGYAPAPIRLGAGFERAPALLAMGAELKSTFCLLREGEAVLSHHLGDLEEARTYADYQRAIDQYLRLFEHRPELIAVDLHPEYLSRKLGQQLSQQRGIALMRIQHHHAHIAACLAENGLPLDAEPVLGVALDGLGYGEDGTLWGGEFVLADYRRCRRLGSFLPVAMPGGARAIREPWRNTYAQLMATVGWESLAGTGASESAASAPDAAGAEALELARFLAAKPRALLDAMIARGINSPRASSCGRLFDAVAAAIGVCREHAAYEGQAAIELEALLDRHTLEGESDELAYPFGITRPAADALPCLTSAPMWLALLADLRRATPAPVIAARFHKGLAIAITAMVCQLRGEAGAARTVALSGGVFQNAALLEQSIMRLTRCGLRVLSHHHVPANDGGLSLGQAAVAAARALPAGGHPAWRPSCV
ncbi:MAG TPA: carbamoyltransferase HypF [Steroidobacteraceae bacterium]|jgi:hydrogenase maturation protein HypF|nr:carbamoyltransferase HypF [Steroidobacteraceae bacterium]